MWEAWSLARSYQKRPSELYAIRDEITAYCFDRAVHLFGSTLESELAAAIASAKNNFQATTRQSNVLRRWLGIEQKFKDPMADGKVKNSSEETAPQGPVKL